LAMASEPGLVVFLSGALGVGKTTLTRGFLRALGYKGPVKSPTYTLVEPYQLSAMSVYHFDFYRVSDPEELELVGIRDYFDRTSTCLVEWPERAAARLPKADMQAVIEFDYAGRRVTLTALTALGTRIIARLAAHRSF
jgi:tRNA threonylcarbamoyladenosine biosynthesis protein TsaE